MISTVRPAGRHHLFAHQRRHITMLIRKGSIALGTYTLALALGLGTLSAQAASVCKGSAQTACNNNDDCSWVNGYKRKDGAVVEAHCKSKPTKKGASGSKKKTEG
jgi:hypothetical protein